MLKAWFCTVVILVLFGSCKSKVSDAVEVPPILGEASVELPKALALISQTGAAYKESDGRKIQVVDFFFTSCPTICPKMTSHLVEVQNHFEGNESVEILSYSIDGNNDTPKVLEHYANSYDIDEDQWKLVTGNPEDIFRISKGYKIMAFDDSFGGERNLIHDGTFVLLDDQRRIRGYYNGLELEDTQRMIDDMEILLKTL